MNICIVSQRYPYQDNMEFVFVKKLVDEWAKMGHRCVVVTEMPWQVYLRKHIQYKPAYYRDEVAPGVFVDVYNPRSFNIPGAGKLNKVWSRYNPQNAFERLLKNLNIRFDFIYCHFFDASWKAFNYAKKNKIPFFVATGESTIPPFCIPNNSFTLDEYRGYTRGVIAVSSKNKEEATQMRLIDASKCKVFPNGTDLRIFTKLDKAECRRKLGYSESDFIISCVGYFCTRKGQNRVLAAIEKLNISNIKVLFIGKAAAIDGVVLESNRIISKGSVPNTELPLYLNASDVFCLPTRYEGCCNAVIEAMACGLPIVSSNRSFNYDILSKDNSILVEPDSINEIAEAIKILYENRITRAALAERAHHDSLNLDIHSRANNILKFIKSNICSTHQ